MLMRQEIPCTRHQRSYNLRHFPAYFGVCDVSRDVHKPAKKQLSLPGGSAVARFELHMAEHTTVSMNSSEAAARSNQLGGGKVSISG